MRLFYIAMLYVIYEIRETNRLCQEIKEKRDACLNYLFCINKILPEIKIIRRLIYFNAKKNG